MLMIQPPPPAASAGWRRGRQKNTPLRFVPITSCHDDSSMSATLRKIPTPALLTRMSRPPNRSPLPPRPRPHRAALPHVGAHD